jgi:hypothetical protein
MAVLALASYMAWNKVPGSTIGTGALAVSTIGAGIALRRFEYQGAGLASGALLTLMKYESWIPQSTLGWGIALLAAGFLLLLGGVAVNLLIVRRLGPARAPEPRAAGRERADQVA